MVRKGGLPPAPSPPLPPPKKKINPPLPLRNSGMSLVLSSKNRKGKEVTRATLHGKQTRTIYLSVTMVTRYMFVEN